MDLPNHFVVLGCAYFVDSGVGAHEEEVEASVGCLLWLDIVKGGCELVWLDCTIYLHLLPMCCHILILRVCTCVHFG